MQKRYISETSSFAKSFRCDHLNILIVCRGPIRMEAMEIFESLGAGYGILLSEKDSVTYPHTLAPELRLLTDPNRVHRIPDYTGANREERQERIGDIIDICNSYNYSHIFAGYGFMAEDADFVEAIENAGIGFIGPRSNVHRFAGAKDQAKKLSRKIGVTVTPGLDNITSVALIAKVGGRAGLEKLTSEHGFTVDSSLDDEDYAETILYESYKKGVSLISVEDLQDAAKKEVESILKDNPGKRIRLKYIGGGGGKGQRIVNKPDQVPDAVMEVLSESKALGPLDNKNFLIEMNIESTRHNEIQLIGNGSWAIALGGRDCSLQMHEQKLVEISITDELFAEEIDKAKKEGQDKIATRLEKDRGTLKEMEDQAERFAEAVGLNSASTFECIVSDESHYFMEMNTRIQVEHRVTEMAYKLRFHNPDNKDDYFDVESLVECMVLCSAHADKLPRPERILRHSAGGEIRLNAMNDALAPHAGSLIESWTPPVEHEIRDDQGIGLRNPDTRSFIHYHLAGAYDSNIALIVTYADSRKAMLARLADILRQMEIRGNELSTNKEFHYGILNFLLGMHPMLKPDTRFTVPYLSLVGTLAGEMEGVDIDYAFKKLSGTLNPEEAQVLSEKHTLIVRPLKMLFENPHVMNGWVFRNRDVTFRFDGDKIAWLQNPVFVLKDLYDYVRLEGREAPPSQKIWDHDETLLDTAIEFYEDLARYTGKDARSNFAELDQLIRNGSGLPDMDDELFEKCKAAHIAWQAGLSLLGIPFSLGKKAGCLEFHHDDELKVVFPDKFNDAEYQKTSIRNLAPPPVASADLIVAASGGMFYSRETPTSDPYVGPGDHFDAGQPLYIIEVMKMFNKVMAEFSGTITECLVPDDGVVVKKGQPIFRVKPDEERKIETPEEAEKRRKEYTDSLLAEL